MKRTSQRGTDGEASPGVARWRSGPRLRFGLLASLLLVGCGESPAPIQPVTACVDLVFSDDWAITEKGLDEPLTDEEVRSFIELVKSLPEGKPPEFAPVPGSAGPDARTPEESVAAWRKAVRDALTVDTLMQGWAPRSSVRRALSERQVTPRALTSLMLRMSCALAAEAMGGSRSVSAQRVLAEEQVESLTARMHRDEQSRVSPPESVWDALGEAASLAEYLTLLSEIPAESQQQVAAHREELQALLPVASNASAPRESREDHRITPIRFEEPVTPVPQRRR